MAATTSRKPLSIGTPLMSARGTITSSTRSSPKLNALRTSSRPSSLKAVAPFFLGLGEQLLQRLAHAAGLCLAAPGEIAHAAHETVEERWLGWLPLGQLLHGGVPVA